jgi:hypothetical protein
VNEGVILSDNRTLDTLTRLLALPGITSAGCSLISSRTHSKGADTQTVFSGAVPLRSTRDGADMIEPVDCGALFPRQTFLVAAQSEACFMTLLDEASAPAEWQDQQRHVFTTRVAIELPLSARDQQPPTPSLWFPPGTKQATSLRLTRLQQ